MIDICRKLVLLLNVWKYSFFEHLHSKFAKHSSPKKQYEVTINGAFYADSKLVDTGSRNGSEKKVWAKNIEKEQNLKISIFA